MKKASDELIIWKATVRIACVKVEKTTKRIESYKLLNLKQFLRVFKTFKSHLEVMDASQVQTVSYKRTNILFGSKVNYTY